MDNLLQAKKYLSKGICVLPVRPLEKRPYMNNWHKYINTKPTDMELETWYKSLAGAGVGAVTGKISGMVVLDVDNRFQGEIKDLIKSYPTNRIAKSGGGGYHLFYSYPKDVDKIQNAVNLIEGVDLRADGGFIVLPPTIHSSGIPYTWEKEGKMGEFPKELVDLRKEQKQNTNEKWVSEILRGVSAGGRNDALARLSGYFFRKGLSIDIIQMLLSEWNLRNDPPLPMEELLTTINSIQKNHINNQQFVSIDFVDDTKEKLVPNEFGVMNLRKYFKQFGGEGTSWLIDDWLPTDSVTFLISPPESYKTWILLDLAVSVASGLPFLGKFEVNKPGPILLIQQEDAHEGIMERLSVIIQSRLNLHSSCNLENEWEVPILPDLPIYIHPDRLLKFSDQKVMDSLEKVISEIKPSVVMIDPLYSTTSTDNYMSSTAEQMLRLKTMRDKYKCSFLIAHHSKKNVAPDSTAREDAWGSQFLNAFLETGWQIRRSTKLEDNEVVVRRHSKTMGNITPVVLKFDISTKQTSKYEVTVKDYASVNAGISGPMENIVMLLSNSEKPLSQTEISDRLGKSKSTISRQISKLTSMNVIKSGVDGKYTNLILDEEE